MIILFTTDLTVIFIHHLEIQSEIPEIVLLRCHFIISNLFEIDQSLINMYNIFLEPCDFHIDISIYLFPLQNLEMLHIFINDLIMTLISKYSITSCQYFRSPLLKNVYISFPQYMQSLLLILFKKYYNSFFLYSTKSSLKFPVFFLSGIAGTKHPGQFIISVLYNSLKWLYRLLVQNSPFLSYPSILYVTYLLRLLLTTLKLDIVIDISC